MTPEEARVHLEAALAIVRKRFDEGGDDWRHALLRTYREYSRAIGIERALLDPLERLLLETDNAIFAARRPRRGKPPMPLQKAAPLAYAAAAVTTLRQRGQNVTDAVKAVARASGLPAAEIRAFRDTINRGLASPRTAEGYQHCLVAARNLPTLDLMRALAGLAKFVK